MKYVPKHRTPPRHRKPPRHELGQQVRRSLAVSGVAVLATGLTVGAGVVRPGVLSADGPRGGATGAAPGSRPGSDASETAAHQHRGPDRGSRDAARADGQSAARSAERAPLDPKKVRALSQKSGGMVTRTENLADEDPRTIARALLPQFGFDESEFSCLDALYNSESGWDPHADNPTSSAYGIPQALTSSTDNLPSDYMTSPASQIRWGLEYIRESYGTPCSAWEFKQSHNWY